ncbi:MAG: DUF3383 domain-containing protein [Endomicrobium sp.]|jgi:hypothetical protein|nr:DUF3383 domain-containing protein [Endomicrobium sp.]
MGNVLDISNVINVSVASAPQGIGEPNINNALLITSDAPAESFTEAFGIYASASAVAADFGSSSLTARMAEAIFAQQPNILAGNGKLIIAPLIEGEGLAAAIVRLKSLVSFCAIMTTTASDVLTDGAAAYVQAQNNMILYTVSNNAEDIAVGGNFDLIRQAGFTKTRCLSYLSATTTEAKLFMAAYVGRAHSVNFSGDNTTITMHLKDLAGILPDPTMTQTQLTLAQNAGADTYVNIAGVSKVFTSGKNEYWDAVYNLTWLVLALQTAGFNTFAQTSTKITQTENGADILKGNLRKILEQGATSGYLAAGTWTRSDTFGNQEALLRNISEYGYYIYTQPINQQPAADRDERIAPLVQIAVKAAGAMHKGNIMIYVNA